MEPACRERPSNAPILSQVPSSAQRVLLGRLGVPLLAGTSGAGGPGYPEWRFISNPRTTTNARRAKRKKTRSIQVSAWRAPTTVL